MISRLSACAALFAIVATAGLAFAAEAQQRPATRRVASATSMPMPMIILPRVEVIGKRAPRH